MISCDDALKVPEGRRDQGDPTIVGALFGTYEETCGELGRSKRTRIFQGFYAGETEVVHTRYVGREALVEIIDF